MALSNQSELPWFFSSRQVNLKNFYKFRLTTSRNRSSPEDDFVNNANKLGLVMPAKSISHRILASTKIFENVLTRMPNSGR
jgi:hypothetical protein